MKKSKIFSILLITFLPIITLVSIALPEKNISEVSNEQELVETRHEPIQDDDYYSLSSTDQYTDPETYATVTEVNSASEFYNYYGVEMYTGFQIGIQSSTDPLAWSHEIMLMAPSCSSSGVVEIIGAAMPSGQGGSSSGSWNNVLHFIYDDTPTSEQYVAPGYITLSPMSSNSDEFDHSDWYYRMEWNATLNAYIFRRIQTTNPASDGSETRNSFIMYIQDNNTPDTVYDDTFILEAHPNSHTEDTTSGSNVYFGSSFDNAGCSFGGSPNMQLTGEVSATVPSTNDFKLLPRFAPNINSISLVETTATETTIQYEFDVNDNMLPYTVQFQWRQTSPSTSAWTTVTVPQVSQDTIITHTFPTTPGNTYEVRVLIGGSNYSMIYNTGSGNPEAGNVSFSFVANQTSTIDNIDVNTTYNPGINDDALDGDETVTATASVYYDNYGTSRNEDIYFRLLDSQGNVVSGYDWNTATSLDDLTTSGTYSIVIPDLITNTEYTIEMRIESRNGETSTQSLTFETDPVPSEIYNVSATSISQTNAFIEYDLSENEENAIVEYRLSVDTNSDGNFDQNIDQVITLGSDNNSSTGTDDDWARINSAEDGSNIFSINLLGVQLTPNTEYVVDLSVNNDFDTNDSIAFSTLTTPANTSEARLTAITDTQATISYKWTGNDSPDDDCEYIIIDNTTGQPIDTDTSASTSLMTWTDTTATEIADGTYSLTVGTGTSGSEPLVQGRSYTVMFRTNGEIGSNDSITFTLEADASTEIQLVSLESVTETTATISYTTGSAAPNEKVVINATDSTGGVVTSTSTNAVLPSTYYTQTITGLTGGEIYTIDMAFEGQSVERDNVLTFSTSIMPSTISDVNEVDKTTTTATVGYQYQKNSGNGDVEYRTSVNSTWTDTPNNEVDGYNELTITGLDHNEQYSMQFRVDGQSSSTSFGTFSTSNDVAKFEEINIKSKTTTSVTYEYVVNKNDGNGDIRYTIDEGQTWVDVQEEADGSGEFIIDNLAEGETYLVVIEIDGINQHSEFIETQNVYTIAFWIPLILLIVTSILLVFAIALIIWLVTRDINNKKTIEDITKKNILILKDLEDNHIITRTPLTTENRKERLERLKKEKKAAKKLYESKKNSIIAAKEISKSNLENEKEMIKQEKKAKKLKDKENYYSSLVSKNTNNDLLNATTEEKKIITEIEELTKKYDDLKKELSLETELKSRKK